MVFSLQEGIAGEIPDCRGTKASLRVNLPGSSSQYRPFVAVHTSSQERRALRDQKAPVTRKGAVTAVRNHLDNSNFGRRAKKKATATQAFGYVGGELHGGKKRRGASIDKKSRSVGRGTDSGTM